MIERRSCRVGREDHLLDSVTGSPGSGVWWGELRCISFGGDLLLASLKVQNGHSYGASSEVQLELQQECVFVPPSVTIDDNVLGKVGPEVMEFQPRAVVDVPVQTDVKAPYSPRK